MKSLYGLLTIFLASSLAWAGEPVAPTAPTAVDYNPATTPLSIVNVTSASGSDLKTKVEAVTTCGTHVRLPAGVTYTLASQINLPVVAGSCGGTASTNRSAISGSSGAHAVSGSGGIATSIPASGGDDYIVIESANYASLPAAGTRIDSVTDDANMATIVLPSVNSTGAFFTPDNAHHIILRGLHIKPAASTCSSCGLLMFQSPSQTDSTKFPNHIYIERSHLEGPSGGGASKGVQMTGAHMGIVDSVVQKIGQNLSGADQQAVLLPGGGPFLVRNNSLSATSETVMMGDNQPINNDPLLITSDVTIQGNYFFKPLSWAPFSTTFPLNATDFASTTAAIDAGGTCVTLTGKTPDAAWATGNPKYFITTADKDASGYYNNTKLISAVGSCNGANSLTLATANSTRAGQSGLSYHISYYDGVHSGSITKNHIECKNCKRVSITGNVLRNVNIGNQYTTIVASSRGGNGAVTDIDIQKNYIKDTWSAFNISFRPTIAASGANVTLTGDGTTNCTGGPCVQINYPGILQCDCTDGETVHISSTNNVTIGTDEAKGIWQFQKISSTRLIIPVRFVTAYIANSAQVTVYHRGTPTSRIRFKDNVIEEPGSWQMAASESAIGRRYTFAINPVPTLTTSDGSNDGALSTTGNWQSPDINIEHNTVVGPALSNAIAGALTLLEGGNTGYSYAGDQLMPNHSWRSNIIMYSGEGSLGATNYGLLGTLNTLAGSSNLLQGPNGVIARTDDGTTNWANNIFYKTGLITATNEYTKQTGSYVNNAVLADSGKVGFASYTTSTPSTLSNFALNDLFTTGTCSTSTASLTVTCSVALPASIVKGTPFKVNSDGRFCAVDTVAGDRLSTTLRASVGSCTASGYPSTNASAAFTFGFKGSGHDGTDPGANMATVMSAISGVVQTISGVQVDP